MKYKQIIALLLSLTVLLTFMACGSVTESTPSAPSDEPSEQAETTLSVQDVPTEEPEEPSPTSEEDVENRADPTEDVPAEEPPEERPTITYPLTEGNLEISMSFDMPGGVGARFADFNEHPVFQEAEQRTGVHINFVSSGGMRDAEALALWSAAGTMPDLIPNGAANYPGGGEVAVAEDVLMDVLPYMEYAPDYNYYRTRDPQDEQDSLTDSGYVVAVTSFFSEDIGPSTGPMIRQDWLDALGLETPVTYDDWHDVLSAFKQAYAPDYTFLLPNTVSAQNNYFASGFDVLSFTANGRGRVTDPFYQVNGEAKFSLLEDGFREYVTLLNQWYAEGLISRDFVTCEADTNGPDLQGYVTSGATGIWFGDVTQMQTYDDSANDPSFHCVAITDPVKEPGQITHFDSDRTGLTSYSVAASCQNPEVVMEWINYWFTDEGIRLSNYGIEGVSYTLDENDTPAFTDLMLHNPDGETFKTCQLLYTMAMVPTVLNTRLSFGFYSDAQLEAQEIWASNIDDAYVLPDISMTEEESQEFTAIYSDLSTMTSEKLIRFIIGDEDIVAWPDFVEQLKGMHAERCLEIYQTALDRYNNR